MDKCVVIGSNRLLAACLAPSVISHKSIQKCSLTINNGDFSIIMYYQNYKINFKQTLFTSCTEGVTQGAISTPASTRWSAPFSTQE
jgi:hypothetical protein